MAEAAPPARRQPAPCAGPQPRACRSAAARLPRISGATAPPHPQRLPAPPIAARAQRRPRGLQARLTCLAHRDGAAAPTAAASPADSSPRPARRPRASKPGHSASRRAAARLRPQPPPAPPGYSTRLVSCGRLHVLQQLPQRRVRHRHQQQVAAVGRAPAARRPPFRVGSVRRVVHTLPYLRPAQTAGASVWAQSCVAEDAPAAGGARAEDTCGQAVRPGQSRPQQSMGPVA